MIYPSVLLSVTVLAVYLLFTKILPGIFDMVSGFNNVKLPPTTVFLMGMTDFLTTNTVKIVIFTILFVLAAGTFLSTEFGKQWMDKHIFQLPLLGKVTRYYDMIKFMRYMRLLMQS
jgi:general secretion pathway protein F